jgi:CHAT domain-containing protein/tetratricopeptide (TPR) repeat protein
MMLNIKKISTALLLAAMPFFVFGQCPENINMRKAIENRNVAVLEDLAKRLPACEKWQDSLAFVYHTLGVAAYIDGDLNKATEVTQQALLLRKKVLPEPHYETGRSYRNLGVFYKELGQWDAAAEHFKGAAETFNGLDSADVADAYRELALVYYQQGDFDRSVQSLELATQKARSFGDEYTLLSCFLEFGNILPEKELFQPAIDSLLKAEKMLAGYDPGWEHAVCFTNLALNYSALEQYERSIDYGEQAIVLWAAMEAPWEWATTLNNQGVTLMHSRQYAKAETVLLEGQKVASDNDLPLILSQSYDNLGELYFLQNQNDKALEYFHKAVMIHMKETSNRAVLTNPSAKDLTNVVVKKALLNDLSDKGKALLAVYKAGKDAEYVKAALETYKLCDHLTDLLRREHTVKSSKIFWREKVVPIYEKAIEAAYLLNDYESAFFFFEKSRAVMLLDAMLNAEALNTINDEQLKTEENRLRTALIDARQRLDEANADERGKILSELVDLNDQFEALTKKLSEQFPNYHNVKYATEVVSLHNLQQQQAGSTLIHYFLGEEHTWMLAVSSEKNPVLKQIGRTELTQKLVKDYLQFFANAFAIANDPQGYAVAASKLYEYLLAPAEAGAAAELIIVPDGILGFLPFEALLTAPVDHGDLGRMPYLILERSVRLTFSATVLEQQSKERSGNGKLLAFAPFSGDNGFGDYPGLPFSADELSQIQTTVAGKYLIGKKASKSSFEAKMNKYSVLHLSTHAEANQAGGQPLIAFADTVLFLNELYSMSIPAKLIVLSACETNIGEVKSGEGIFSLSRGFAYAGANSTIASLWNVNAASTGQIFPVFYKSLSNGAPKSRALRKAKLDYLNSEKGNGHIKTPYDWAGFALMGNDENIELKSPSNPWFYYVVPLVIFAAVILIRRKNRTSS